MDSDSTITSLFLAVAVLAYLALHGGQVVLRRVQSSEVRRLLSERGVSSFAVRRLRASMAASQELLGALRLTSVGASYALALGLLFGQLSIDWPVILGGMAALWAGMLLLRPLVVAAVEGLPANRVPSLAMGVLVVLWLFWPVGWIGKAGRRLGRRGTRLPETALAPGDEEADVEVLDPRVRGMIRAIPKLHETTVREIMIPRVDITAVDVESPLEQAVGQVVGSGHSRLPVYRDTIDNIVGVLYARDLLKATADHAPGEANLGELVRHCFFVPESKRLDQLLQELQERHVHMAMVVDEYGGIAGLVTIEDLLEEIVGEIEDEFDIEQPTIQTVQDGEMEVDARISVDAFNEAFSAAIGGEGFDTLGGFLYSRLGKIPSPGDLVKANGLHIEVLTTIGRRIQKVRVRQIQEPMEGDSQPDHEDAKREENQRPI